MPEVLVEAYQLPISKVWRIEIDFGGSTVYALEPEKARELVLKILDALTRVPDRKEE